MVGNWETIFDTRILSGLPVTIRFLMTENTARPRQSGIVSRRRNILEIALALFRQNFYASHVILGFTEAGRRDAFVLIVRERYSLPGGAA